MLGAVKGEKTRSQLTDAAQPLKFPGIDEIPDRLILHIDILVNRIFKHFFSSSIGCCMVSLLAICRF